MSVRGLKSKLAKFIDSALPQCKTRLAICRAGNKTAEEPTERKPCARGAKCRCKLIVIEEVIVNTPEEAKAVLARKREAG